MSKLPLLDAKTFEKLLLSLGFKIKRQKGSHVFIVILTVDILLYHITREEILVVR